MSIVDRLSADDRAYVAGLEEAEVIRLHFGLGMHIRNQIRAGELPALFRWCRGQVPNDIHHFDDLTWPIVEAVWRALKAPGWADEAWRGVTDLARKLPASDPAWASAIPLSPN